MSRKIHCCSTTNTSLRKRSSVYSSVDVNSSKTLQVQLVISVFVFVSPQGAQEFSQFLLSCVLTRFIECSPGKRRRQIFLRREIFLVVMTVLVTLPIVQVLHQLRWRIADM